MKFDVLTGPTVSEYSEMFDQSKTVNKSDWMF